MLKNNKKSKSKEIDYEVMFVFKNIDIDLVIDNEMFTEDQINEISRIVKEASKNIYVDKSYVAFKGTKYEKLFFKEDGWNKLKQLLAKTKFGNKCTNAQKEELSTVYELMIKCYIYQFLEDFGYFSDGICIDIEDGKSYQVEIYRDDACGWKSYPGKWQSW